MVDVIGLLGSLKNSVWLVLLVVCVSVLYVSGWLGCSVRFVNVMLLSCVIMLCVKLVLLIDMLFDVMIVLVCVVGLLWMMLRLIVFMCRCLSIVISIL